MQRRKVASGKGPSEKQIENQILNWLEWKRVYAWKTKTTGTYDPATKRFRGASRLYRTGVADIIGILPDNGRLFAIEVKTKTGRLQENQKTFLSEIKARGGLALVARSLEDVEDFIEDIKERA